MPYMTCAELHACCEMRSDTAVHLHPDSTELSQHLAACTECSRFIEQEQEVRTYLAVVRNAAPAIPTSLDASVRAKYRAYVSQQSRSSGSHSLGMWAVNVGATARCVAAVVFATAMVLGGVLLLHVPRQGNPIDRHLTPQHPTVAGATEPPAKNDTVVAKKAAPNPAITASAQHKGRLAGHNDESPIEFQSLMYCDPISCSGAMDVIRVQLSSPVLGTTLASAQADGLVSAEVLVGPDGMARGIRVVE